MILQHGCFLTGFYKEFRVVFFTEHLQTTASQIFLWFINIGQKHNLGFLSIHIDVLLQILVFYQMLLFIEMFFLLLSIFKLNWYQHFYFSLFIGLVTLFQDNQGVCIFSIFVYQCREVTPHGKQE